MAAAADPLSAQSVPVKNLGPCGNDTGKKTKQQQRPLDTALLCSKLEQHQREQQALRVRREKRDAVRNGSYVPRSAARSFAATATPMTDPKNPPRGMPSKRRSAPAPFIAEPLTMDGRICIPARQRYAALNFGTGNSDNVGTSEDEEVVPINPYRVDQGRGFKRDLKKLDERFPLGPPNKSSESSRHPTAAPRKASLPIPAMSEIKSSVQATELQRSKSTSTTPRSARPSPAMVKKEATILKEVDPRNIESAPAQTPLLSGPREVSPPGADEMTSINQDENVTVTAAVEITEEPAPMEEDEYIEERGISLIQALSMDLELPDEAEHSESASSFKWDQYDPFKPRTGDSSKSEKPSARLQSKRDSMNPVHSDSPSANDKETESTPHRRRSSPRSSTQKHISPAAGIDERGRQRYRPGDAAKRRTMADPAVPLHWPVIEPVSTKKELRPASFHAITEARLSRFLEEEVSLDAPIPEVDENLVNPPRPKLVPHDRPNWSQQSESGDDFLGTLNSFFPRAVKKVAQQNRQSSSLAPFAEPRAQRAPSPKRYTGPQNAHLIADAVKIIHQQEKSKRRETVIGFFKKL